MCDRARPRKRFFERKLVITSFEDTQNPFFPLTGENEFQVVR